MTVTVVFQHKRYFLTFSQLPERRFGPFVMAEAIRDLMISANLDRLDARTLVCDATIDGQATREVLQ